MEFFNTQIFYSIFRIKPETSQEDFLRSKCNLCLMKRRMRLSPGSMFEMQDARHAVSSILARPVFRLLINF